MQISIIGDAIAIILSTWKSGNPLTTNIINVIVALAAAIPGLGGVEKAIAAVMGAWVAGASVFDNIVASVVALIANVPNIFGSAALKTITPIAASLSNFTQGQAAVVDLITVPEEISGVVGGRKASLILLYNDGAAGAALGLS